MDEHEKRKVGQEVKEVQGWNVPQLPQGSGLLLQTDPTGLQLQQELLGADLSISWLLIQEEQEQLLRESGQESVKKGRQAWVAALVCFWMFLWGASDYPDLFPGV